VGTKITLDISENIRNGIVVVTILGHSKETTSFSIAYVDTVNINHNAMHLPIKGHDGDMLHIYETGSLLKGYQLNCTWHKMNLVAVPNRTTENHVKSY